MISAASFYLSVGVLVSIIYVIFLLAGTDVPASLAICATLLSILCVIFVYGILYLIEGSYPTVAWVLAIILLVSHILGMIFCKTTFTATNAKGETVTYTA